MLDRRRDAGVDDDQPRAGLPREHVDRRTAGGEVRDHLRGDLLRIGADAFRGDAVVAGRDDDRRVEVAGTKPRIAAIRQASSSSRPRLPRGFVFASSTPLTAAPSLGPPRSCVRQRPPMLLEWEHATADEARLADASTQTAFTRPSTSR